MSGTFTGLNRVRSQLHALLDEVRGVTFAYDVRGEIDRALEELEWTIREYALPRLADLDGPAVAVLIGSTGAGKSTILNSLAGAQISEPGAVRPTTRAPTVWCHPDHADRFGDEFLTGYSTDPEAVRSITVVPAPVPLLEHLAVVDAPDFDSVVDVHREIADELLAVADVCLFVTSAQRYADAVPWEFLAKAKARAIPIRYIVNRLPRPGSEAEQAIIADFSQRLAGGGIDVPDDAIVRIAEQEVLADIGGLATTAVAPIRQYLERLSDDSYRKDLIREAAEGAVAAVARDGVALADLLDEEMSAISRLAAAVEDAYAAQESAIAEALDSGTLIRGEVVRRWQEFVGTGEILKVMTEGANRVRAWGRRVLGGQGRAEAVVGTEARSELVTAVMRRSDIAARTTAGAWDLSPVGRQLLDETMWGHGPQLEDAASAAVQEWMAGLTDLIEQHGEGRHRLAKAASLGVNAVAVALLVTVFVHTGGLTGAEVGVAAGAAAAQQGLLEHIFGSAAANSLAAKARAQLDEALNRVLEEDASRFLRRIEDMMTGDPATIRRVAGQLELAAKAWHDD